MPDHAHPFDSISIIFNPNSTGDAPGMAKELHDELRERLPADAVVELKPTEHAGHAVELAREAAAKGHALVVSVSGDGGYNEVVNGVMVADNPDAVCAVMAAGNANDHRRTTKRQPLADAIVEANVRRIDLLRLVTGDGPDAETHYAHSYIGFGLTPIVAIDIEKGGKGSLKEMVSVVRSFAKFQPFEIRHTNGKVRRIDSLLFANIPQMAKYAKLSEADEEPDDGRFEVVTFPHMPKWRVLLLALRSATIGLGHQPSHSSYEFSTLKPLPYQIDGEVKDVPAETRVRVEIAEGALPVVG
ncbi:diacylglycerol kinase [Paenarthrobacter sp. DKR-5]|uniref:diacylglycerol/lipid kinase family protein n=1 Tax=Paenarthrobacter sp. DKR-5 TaxID=2835535 RepID=UPI001BDD5124|nr:diacylglycerol kinase family protein [Paenarthrobacter sp. DKR-5]MBT1001189.1 diacylglycerol kinase [Paenarthrobacter sp. DKR-5]